MQVVILTAKYDGFMRTTLKSTLSTNMFLIIHLKIKILFNNQVELSPGPARGSFEEGVGIRDQGARQGVAGREVAGREEESEERIFKLDL